MRPDDRKYQQSHEWAKNEGEITLIGITDFAVEALTDLVFIDLPEVGTGLSRGEEFGEIESVKAVSSLYAPVGGEVVEVHDALADDLDLLSNDPLGAGWMLKIKPSNPADYEGLMSAAEYEKIVESES
jgi:glycine cleavage system H protein